MDIPPNNQPPFDADQQYQYPENGGQFMKGNKICRPMNAFLLWSTQERRKLKTSKMLMSSISKLLGAQWKEMTMEQKAPYVMEAKRLRGIHAIEHPDYKYQPRKKPRKVVVKKVPETMDGGMEGHMFGGSDMQQIYPNMPFGASTSLFNAFPPDPTLSNLYGYPNFNYFGSHPAQLFVATTPDLSSLQQQFDFNNILHTTNQMAGFMTPNTNGWYNELLQKLSPQQNPSNYASNTVERYGLETTDIPIPSESMTNGLESVEKIEPITPLSTTDETHLISPFESYPPINDMDNMDDMHFGI